MVWKEQTAKKLTLTMIILMIWKKNESFVWIIVSQIDLTHDSLQL